MLKGTVRLTALLALALGACNLPSASGPIASPTSSPVGSEEASATSSPSRPPLSTWGALPSEVILILEPGAGSRLTSPLRVAGLADPTFEQNLGIRLVLPEGSVLAQGAATIQADIGQRGPFEAEIPFTVSDEQNALIQVYDQSARDGGIIHLASMGVTLAPSGAQVLEATEPHQERLVIHQPANGETVQGGTVRVAGFGAASFEGTLLVEVYGPEGDLLGSASTTVQSAEAGMGEPGPFSVQVAYELRGSGPGRIAVVDPLPAFDGVGHIASVGITLEP